MDSLASDVQERTFDMDAEHPWDSSLDRLLDRFDGARDDIQVVADQGREESRRAELPMGPADGP